MDLMNMDYYYIESLRNILILVYYYIAIFQHNNLKNSLDLDHQVPMHIHT